jgi:hypothetical protein
MGGLGGVWVEVLGQHNARSEKRFRRGGDGKAWWLARSCAFPFFFLTL